MPIRADGSVRKKEVNRSTISRSKERSQVFRDLLSIADAQGIYVRTGVSTGDALQRCLDRAVALWEFAASQTDAVAVAPDPNSPDGTGGGFFELQLLPGGASEYVPNKWYRVEREARLDIEKLAGMMTQLGIAERQVRIQEAQAALFVAQIREAAIEAGLSPSDVRSLGEALRRRVAGAIVDVHSEVTSAQKAQGKVIARQSGRQAQAAEAGR